MPFDFTAQEAIIRECLIGLEVPPPDTTVSQPQGHLERELLLHSNSRLFFALRMGSLNHRCNGLQRRIAAEKWLPEHEQPSLVDWQAATKQRPLTLRAILRIRQALEVVHNKDPQALQTAAGPVLLGPNSIAPSIYVAHDGYLSKLREACGLKRRELSMEACGKPELLRFVEDGDGSIAVRVTKKTAEAIHQALVARHPGQNIHFYDCFSFDHHVSSVAARVEWGNLL